MDLRLLDAIPALADDMEQMPTQDLELEHLPQFLLLQDEGQLNYLSVWCCLYGQAGEATCSANSLRNLICASRSSTWGLAFKITCNASSADAPAQIR